jgi:hypothetical protein
VTYSPKAFLPVTQLCRDNCGYCTFAKPPRPETRAFMTPDEVWGAKVSLQGVVGLFALLQPVRASQPQDSGRCQPTSGEWRQLISDNLDR